MGFTSFLNLFFALIFSGAGTAGGCPDGRDGCCPGPECSPLLAARFGAVVNFAIGLMFGSAQPVLLAFPLERPTFLREYNTATYGVLPYFLSKTVVELVLTLATAAIA